MIRSCRTAVDSTSAVALDILLSQALNTTREGELLKPPYGRSPVGAPDHTAIFFSARETEYSRTGLQILKSLECSRAASFLTFSISFA